MEKTNWTNQKHLLKMIIFQFLKMELKQESKIQRSKNFIHSFWKLYHLLKN